VKGKEKKKEVANVKAWRLKTCCKNLKHIILNYISVYSILLRCYAFSTGKYLPTFRSKFIPVSSSTPECRPKLHLVASVDT
jgi:hypothetical protein